MTDDRSAQLVELVRAGDEQAATELFQRYVERLTALAAAHMSAKLARRLDPEDVVQSACRSFFLKARAGRYILEHSGDLWRLLVGITLHKLQHQAEHHTAKKRSLAKERSPVSGDSSALGPLDLALARDPSPLEAVALADEVERLMARLEPHHRPILELRLQGHNLDEIADQLKCSERTARRVLNSVKEMIQEGNDDTKN